MELGSKLSICRQNKNMTQEELAKKLGVTPQAISMYERNVRMPDISLLSSLCEILDVSADYLLGINERNTSLDENIQYHNEILSNFRNSLEPLELLVGDNIAVLFSDFLYKKEIDNIRVRLSKEGILMPVLRIRDDSLLNENQFIILSYQNVLYDEVVCDVKLDYIMSRLEVTVREKYAEIINPDIVKNLTDNLKVRYPALIENVVPETISYGLLTKVLKSFMNRGNGIVYLPKVIEFMQYGLLEEPNTSVEKLTEMVIKNIEREDNFWVYVAKDKERKRNCYVR